MNSGIQWKRTLVGGFLAEGLLSAVVIPVFRIWGKQPLKITPRAASGQLSVDYNGQRAPDAELRGAQGGPVHVGRAFSRIERNSSRFSFRTYSQAPALRAASLKLASL
jgi:hypothetical protein